MEIGVAPRAGAEIGGCMDLPLDRLEMPRGEFSRAVRDSLAYIAGHCPNIQSVLQIAQRVGVNYHTLRARFRRETRLTLEECLIRSRVGLACRMILYSDKQIKKIAWDVGYQNENQLTRATKKYLGLTPQIIRRHAKLNNMVCQVLQQAKTLS